MAVYNRAQMTKNEKPKPPEGWCLMMVKKEMPSKQNLDQHIFILENENHSFFFASWLYQIPDFATACGLHTDNDGNCDTADIVGKWVKCLFKLKDYKGKTYLNLIEFDSVSPSEIPELQHDDTNTEDIPF